MKIFNDYWVLSKKDDHIACLGPIEPKNPFFHVAKILDIQNNKKGDFFPLKDLYLEAIDSVQV